MKVPKKYLIFLSLLLFLFWFPNDIASEEIAKGNIIGFVYAQDGTTPLEGAIVKARNITTGNMFQSEKSDKYGTYLIRNVENGVYVIGVESREGGFNGDGLVGVRVAHNETAKMSVSLRSYNQKVVSAMHQVSQKLKSDGKVHVGKVVAFNPSSKMADVSITQGLLKMNDRIHIKGRETFFYQDLNVLTQEGNPVEVVLPGDDASIGLKRTAVANDDIYVVRNKRSFPLYLIPVGVATVVAGNSAIVKNDITVQDNPNAASPFRKQ
jgi:hypothetical protein